MLLDTAIQRLHDLNVGTTEVAEAFKLNHHQFQFINLAPFPSSSSFPAVAVQCKNAIMDRSICADAVTPYQRNMGLAEFGCICSAHAVANQVRPDEVTSN